MTDAAQERPTAPVTKEDHKWVEARKRAEKAPVGLKNRRKFQLQEAANKALEAGLEVAP